MRESTHATPRLRAALWRKSSHSGTDVNCVEVAGLPDAVAVRDSKNLDAGPLLLSHREWRHLVGQLKGRDA